MFLLSNRYFSKLCCAAPGVGDVSHNIVGLLEHPFVTSRDGEARVDNFDAFREHGVGVITGIKFVPFRGQTLQNDGITDEGRY